jgi:hypothetical protein
LQTIDTLIETANNALKTYSYYNRLVILNQGSRYVKFRLYIKRDLLVQVNRNEAAELTNMVLLHNFKRIFARDEYKGNWHRHPISDPDDHNHSGEGSRQVTLKEFLLEVDSILKEKELI